MLANKFIKTLGLLVGLWSLNSQGSAIYYSVTNVNPAENLWQYKYKIAGADFLMDEGFDIYFPASEGYQYGDLKTAIADKDQDWYVKAYQPELALPTPHDGFLDGMALKDDPSLDGLFYIDFIWRGAGNPASQKYELYDDTFAVTETNWTEPFPTTSVPEPEIMLLMLMGLGGYLVNHKSGRA